MGHDNDEALFDQKVSWQFGKHGSKRVQVDWIGLCCVSLGTSLANLNNMLQLFHVQTHSDTLSVLTAHSMKKPYSLWIDWYQQRFTALTEHLSGILVNDVEDCPQTAAGLIKVEK